MTTAPLERTDLSIIEELDWNHEPACDLKAHPTGRYGHDGGPAWALIQVTCPGCSDAFYAYTCKGRWDYMQSLGSAYCDKCGHEGPLADFWRFIALVRP